MIKDGSQNKRIIMILTAIIIVLSFTVALVGLLSNDHYELNKILTPFGEEITLYQKGIYAKNSVSMATQVLAQDMVTIVLGVPALLISLILYIKNSKKGLFLLTGTIGYFLYTYASYSFLIYYNSLYLCYVVLMSVSFFSFILGILQLRKEIDWSKAAEHYPAKMIGIYFVVGGVVISMMWLGRIIPTIASTSAPNGLDNYSTLVIQSLDLGFVVPSCFVIAYLIYRKNSWGYLLSTVLLVKIITLTAAVSTMAVSMYISGAEMNVMEVVIMPTFMVLSAAILIKVLRS